MIDSFIVYLFETPHDWIWEWIRDHGDDRDEEAARAGRRAEVRRAPDDGRMVWFSQGTLIIKSMHIFWRDVYKAVSVPSKSK